MAKFTGAECLVCKEKFSESDDIVVCPECGTPYHRTCYAKENKCINTKLHEENKSWAQEREENCDSNIKRCPYCYAENKQQAFLCENCGASLVENIKFNNQENDNKEDVFGSHNYGMGGFTYSQSNKFCGMNPNDEICENVTVSEAADFVGTNTQFYLLFFKRVKEGGRKLSAEIVSILFPQFYFAYRKMWLMAFLVTLLKTVISIPSLIYTAAYTAQTYINDLGMDGEILQKLASMNVDGAGFNLTMTLANYASVAISVLSVLFAHWIYYKHMQKKISNIKKQYTTSEEITQKISSFGGTSILGIFLVIALEMILSLLLVLGLMCI